MGPAVIRLMPAKYGGADLSIHGTRRHKASQCRRDATSPSSTTNDPLVSEWPVGGRFVHMKDAGRSHVALTFENWWRASNWVTPTAHAHAWRACAVAVKRAHRAESPLTRARDVSAGGSGNSRRWVRHESGGRVVQVTGEGHVLVIAVEEFSETNGTPYDAACFWRHAICRRRVGACFRAPCPGLWGLRARRSLQVLCAPHAGGKWAAEAWLLTLEFDRATRSFL